MKQFDLLTFTFIRMWGKEKGFVKKANIKSQTCKLMEEAGELARAILHNDKPEIIDGIGDCVVVLTLLAEMNGVKIEDCISSAYETIKARKGNVKDGCFIKGE